MFDFSRANFENQIQMCGGRKPVFLKNFHLMYFWRRKFSDLIFNMWSISGFTFVMTNAIDSTALILWQILIIFTREVGADSAWRIFWATTTNTKVQSAPSQVNYSLVFQYCTFSLFQTSPCEDGWQQEKIL